MKMRLLHYNLYLNIVQIQNDNKNVTKNVTKNDLVMYIHSKWSFPTPTKENDLPPLT